MSLAKPENNTMGFQPLGQGRDFVGYGGETPKDCWPNGAKIAVSFVLNYEEGAEHTIWNDDKRSVEFLFETHFQRTPLQGRRDTVIESQFEYGTRAGLPRILKLFRKFGWKMTLWQCSRALECAPEYTKIMMDDGHEIACHGNRWRNTPDLAGPDEEYADVLKSFDRIQKLTGRQDLPAGFFTGNGSLYHRHIRARAHKARGLPLLYNSDTYSGDLPYWIESPLVVDGDEDEGMLMVPYSLTNNDHRFLCKGNGVAASADWYDLLKGDFDVLYQEGVEGQPKMMTIAMHNRVLGKPGRIMALKRFMEYIATKPDVWVCTRSEIAQVWREKYPYKKVGVTHAV
ncbi:hypothetical protein MNV49_002251 [Pseudohyphozyma bogoriensis]|nr:hypothetical protein MNV49_002251 [Pseudohyphozyma bogoriensis]